MVDADESELLSFDEFASAEFKQEGDIGGKKPHEHAETHEEYIE